LRCADAPLYWVQLKEIRAEMRKKNGFNLIELLVVNAMQPLHLTKKLLVIILAAFLLPATASATKILKYTDHEPLGGMRTRFIKDVFFSAIEKESNDRLKIEDHWGGEIASGYDALRVVGEKGAADMTIVVPEYAPKDLPLHQIFKSFPTGPTGDKQLVFYRRVYAEIPAFPAELKKENVVNLLFGTGFPVAFFGTKPLNALEDIKGGKWRSASFWHQDFLRNAGAIPVSMPWGEGIYKALQAGTLDGLMVNVDSGYELKVHETAPNVLISKDLWLGHVYLLVMNKNTWDRLAKEDKEAIQRAAEIAYKTLGSVMDSSFDAQVEDMKKGGVKIRILKSRELEQWKAATKFQEVQAAWVKEQEGKGMKDVGPVLEKVNAIMIDVMK
jgi:TRAP-type C4-dicarboxylate transport system substrate-binding protein